MDEQTITKHEQTLRALLFWDEVAMVYESFGLPKDLIGLELRKSGVPCTDENLDALLKHMVGLRNKRIERNWERTTSLLIPLPSSFSVDVVDALVRLSCGMN